MSIAGMLKQELEQEQAATRMVIERVPPTADEGMFQADGRTVASSARNQQSIST